MRYKLMLTTLLAGSFYMANAQQAKPKTQKYGALSLRLLYRVKLVAMHRRMR